MKKEENMMPESGIKIYTNPDNTIQLEVKLEKEMIWVTAQQMAVLFGRDVKTIRKHINNAKREELAGLVVGAKFASTSKHGAIEGKTQVNEVEHYNLEMVTSVGYRVKSKQGVRFRQWANRILKDYLIKGYAIRDNIQLQHYNELKEVVALMQRTMSLQEETSKEEYSGLFNVISDYVYALDTLDYYDYQELTISKTTKKEHFHASYENAMEAIGVIRR